MLRNETEAKIMNVALTEQAMQRLFLFNTIRSVTEEGRAPGSPLVFLQASPPLLSCWKSKTIITYTAVNGPSGFKFFSSNDVNMQSSQFLEIYRSKIKRKFRLKQKFCKSYLKVKRHIVVKNRKSKVNCLTD